MSPHGDLHIFPPPSPKLLWIASLAAASNEAIEQESERAASGVDFPIDGNRDSPLSSHGVNSPRGKEISDRDSGADFE